MIRSVMSRSTGFPGRWYVPQAQDPPAAWLFCQMISPRRRYPRLSRMSMTSRDNDAVGPPAQVGHVHGDAAAGLELVQALVEDAVQHLEVGVEVGGDVALPIAASYSLPAK